AATAALAPAGGPVRVIVGPTPIPGGDARAANDITVVNGALAFAIAVDSPVPYGVPRGALVDVAAVRGGVIGHDHVVFADFIPNAWSAWPNTFHRVTVLERGPRRVVVRAERDWGAVLVTTTYTLAAGSDTIAIATTMHNRGTEPLRGLLSGMTLWQKGGFRFGLPGVASCDDGPATGALADRVVAYGRHWSIALHAPYLDHVANGCRDLFRRHDLAPGAARRFDAWLQVGVRDDLAPVVRESIEREHLPHGRIHGRVVFENGTPVPRPVVVAERRGTTYAWAVGHDGRYRFELPAGRYTLYATGHDDSDSAKTQVVLAPGADRRADFRGLAPAGRVRFTITDAATGAPLDARLTIVHGAHPVVETLGGHTFFTDLDRRGRASFAIAPGHTVFEVESGGDFLGPGRRVPVDVAPGRTTAVAVRLARWFDPPRAGWYAADLHHHADQAEAVTPPRDLARSQLAAGLDLLFVSDHDSTVNLPILARIAAARRIPFLPSIEFSPSWGHINAYPLRLDAKPTIDPSSATIEQIIHEAHQMGATVVQINHPYIPYGYFTSLAHGTAPGGFDPHFDLVEINAAAAADDGRVLHTMWSFWNAGDRYYLAGGTDTHDVWNEVSGRVRTFAHLDGRPTAARFADALRAGHAYVSYGPLIEPRTMFGDDLKTTAGAPFDLAFRLESVEGLAQVTLIENGRVHRVRRFPGAPRRADVDFRETVGHAGWFSLVVEDAAGRRAYTDPIWVDVVDASAATQASASAASGWTPGSARKNASTTAGSTASIRAGRQRGRLSLSTINARTPSSKSP
ncbi:MAG: CehA/McbA family metallohydrolase, partial [Gammaproteobacteria bacterium]|nr:CehA/McbA family metallohydrolase [Gammaproteobacteria bacterium]